MCISAAAGAQQMQTEAGFADSLEQRASVVCEILLSWREQLMESNAVVFMQTFVLL